MPEPTKIAMRKDFTLPFKYLFKLGMEPWKPNAVKNTGLAEIIKALSIGIAIKLSNLMFGSINASTKIKAEIITKNNTRLILSTLWCADDNKTTEENGEYKHRDFVHGVFIAHGWE